MNGDIPPLRDVFFNFVKGRSDGFVSMWDMTEVAKNPVRFLWDGEGKWCSARVCDESGIVCVASGSKACDNQSNVRELCGLTMVLASSQINGGSIRESDNGSVIAGLMY